MLGALPDAGSVAFVMSPAIIRTSWSGRGPLGRSPVPPLVCGSAIAGFSPRPRNLACLPCGSRRNAWTRRRRGYRGQRGCARGRLRRRTAPSPARREAAGQGVRAGGGALCARAAAPEGGQGSARATAPSYAAAVARAVPPAATAAGAKLCDCAISHASPRAPAAAPDSRSPRPRNR